MVCFFLLQNRIPFTVCLNAFLSSVIDFFQTASNGGKIRPSIHAALPALLVHEIIWPVPVVSAFVVVYISVAE